MKAKRFTKKVLMTAIFMVALAMVLVPASAQLQVAVTAYDTVNTAVGYSKVIHDNEAGFDFDPAVGAISLGNGFTPIANFVVQGSYHTSNKAANRITSGSSTVTNNRATTTRAYVAVSDTDFTPPANVASLTGSGTFTDATGSAIRLEYYDDPANAQGANYAFADYNDFLANAWKLTPGNMVGSYDFTAADDDDSFSYNPGDVAVNDVDPFSMTLKFDFTLTSGGMLVSRGQSMNKDYDVPEFPTLALPTAMLIGLVGAVLFIRKTKES